MQDALADVRELVSESPAVGALAADTFRSGPGDSVRSVVEALRGRAGATPAWIAVCDGEQLMSLVAVSQLLMAGEARPIEQIDGASFMRVDASISAESAAWLATMTDAELVAVEDDAGRFQGIVPLSRFLPLLVHEHEEDIARLGGFLRGSRTARTASEEPIHRRVLHRAPWLLVGLLGTVAAAQIVRAFKVELEETVALAFFLPGIVYMADAVGTQTETLVIRGLSVGVPVRRILRLEVVTGVLIGGLLSLGIFPLALAITGDASLAFVVALSLLASAMCATVIAMTLPWAMNRLGLDPAFGSGPLATVLQDLVSILIYFGIAVALIS
jgi:magnesium transporter